MLFPQQRIALLNDYDFKTFSYWKINLSEHMVGGSAGPEPLAPNLVWQEGQVSPLDRARLLKQIPATVWFTGLSGAGKSTLAFALEHRLVSLGRACFVLDGDNVRHGLNRDLGFSHADRTENIRRIAEVAKLMNQAGLIVISAFISPYRADREIARDIVGKDSFREIHVSTSLHVCEGRDTKGLYKRAREGKIPEFTGITAPYEAPMHPALALDTAALPLADCITALLEELGVDQRHASRHA
ncbi:adenylyl-sulfate kinase [soil metagenome]